MLNHYKTTLKDREIQKSTTPDFIIYPCSGESEKSFNQLQITKALHKIKQSIQTRSTTIIHARISNDEMFFTADVGDPQISTNYYKAVILGGSAFLVYENITNCRPGSHRFLTSIIDGKDLLEGKRDF
ncbi:unnamed protein product [Caenorhabditis angaria]|uniref:Uncharacterized protein n=1 Tax=Caenorhabditis angaria TaxID=860376 RepID=A0A9P1I7L0_9PELO|nr:unnamed protein product [Caenorhabditis angaria]